MILELSWRASIRMGLGPLSSVDLGNMGSCWGQWRRWYLCLTGWPSVRQHVLFCSFSLRICELLFVNSLSFLQGSLVCAWVRLQTPTSGGGYFVPFPLHPQLRPSSCSITPSHMQGLGGCRCVNEDRYSFSVSSWPPVSQFKSTT